MSATQLYPPDFRASPIKAPPRRRNPRSVTVPRNVTPVVRLVFIELARQQMTYDFLEEVSGIRRQTVKQWRKKNRSSWESLEAVLSTLGFGFVATPALQVLPPELAGEVTALAMKLGADIPTTWAALIDIGVEQRLLRMDAEEKRAALAEREARNSRQAANDNTPRRRRAKPA